LFKRYHARCDSPDGGFFVEELLTAARPKILASGSRSMLANLLVRFPRNRNANVAVIAAFTMVPIIFLLGMTLDFTQALRKKEQLDAAADAAAMTRGIRPRE
jgi:hypothetical protein